MFAASVLSSFLLEVRKLQSLVFVNSLFVSTIGVGHTSNLCKVRESKVQMQSPVFREPS